MSALLVVTPVVAPTVPIVNARLSLRNAKLLPAPVTFAAKVPIWLASSIDTGPTAVMLSVLAMTGGVSLMPAPAISCRVRPAISIVAARLMFDPESSFKRLLTLVGPSAPFTVRLPALLAPITSVSAVRSAESAVASTTR